MFDIHATTAAAFTVSVDGDTFRYSDINAECRRKSCGHAEDQLGKRPQDYFPSPLAGEIVGHYRRCVETRLPVSYLLDAVLASGFVCWRTTLVPIVSAESHRVTDLVGICVDTTAETLAERARSAFHDTLSRVLGAIEGGFWIFVPTTEQFEVSRSLTDLLAGPDHPLLGLAEYLNYIFAEDLAQFVDLTSDSTADFRVMTHDGRTRWLQSKRRLGRDESGAVTHVIGLVLDVTEERVRLQQLEVEATTDELTGLKNRRSFERSAANLLSYPFCASPRPLSLLLVDLDGFKLVNDVHGHQAGDALLRTVARRLSRLVRPEDMLARIGGDEFAILLRDDDPARMVERIERAFTRPFLHNETKVRTGASVGVAIQQKTDHTLAELMHRADKDLYARKGQRRRLTA